MYEAVSQTVKYRLRSQKAGNTALQRLYKAKDRNECGYVECNYVGQSRSRPHMLQALNVSVFHGMAHCCYGNASTSIWSIISASISSKSCINTDSLQRQRTYNRSLLTPTEVSWSPVSIQTQSRALRALRLDGSLAKRKRLRWQAANHGCHCFDRASYWLLLRLRLARFPSKSNARDCVSMETGLEYSDHRPLWSQCNLTVESNQNVEFKMRKRGVQFTVLHLKWS